MPGHNIDKHLYDADTALDPGSGGTITADRSPMVVPLISAGAEARTLDRPAKPGGFVTLYGKTVVGTITVTVTGGLNETGDTTFAISAAGQFAMFQAIEDGSNLVWRLFSHYGLGDISPTEAGFINGLTADATELNTMDGILATTAELNRAADVSTRLIAAGATLSVTEALHDGKIIRLDTATGSVCTLPAATGSGAVFHFKVSVLATSNSHIVKVANASDIIQGIVNLIDTDTAGTTTGFATAADSDTITLNRSTTGSVMRGEWLELVDVATNLFLVRGQLANTGSGATPFSATV